MKTLAFVLALLPAVLAAQQFTTPIRINSDTTITDREPAMHIGPNGSIYVSWIKVHLGGGGDAYFTRSDDGGQTFIPTVRATNGAKIPADNQRGAPFAIDTKGNIHMVWVEMRHKNSENKVQPDVFYVRSTDNGMTWSTEVVLSDDSMEYDQDFPSLACDSSGNVYLTFLDAREQKLGIKENVQLYLRKSTDNGLSWSRARRINTMPDGIGGTCECCKQDVQAGLNGLVTVAFRTSINGTSNPDNDRRDVYVIRSTDYGMIFSEAFPVQAQPWTLAACPVTGPNTHLTTNGDLHVTWRDARDAAGGDAHVYYDILPAGATQTVFAGQNNIRLDQNENLPNWPDVSVFGPFTAIAYETGSTKSTYTLLGASGAPYFSVPFPGSGDKKFMSVQFAEDGTRYFVWQDASYPTHDIVFMKDTSALPVAAVHPDKLSERLFLVPNPAGSGKTVTFFSSDETTYDRYHIMDLLGKTIQSGPVSSNNSVALPHLAKGSYVLRLFSNTGAKSQTIVIGD